MNSDDFIKIADVSEGLENKIEKAVGEATSLDALYELIKSKRYTHTPESGRIILRAYLGIECIPDEAPRIYEF